MNPVKPTASALVLLVPLAGAAFAQDAPGRDERPVVVTTGEHVIRQAPDRAFVTIATEARHKQPQEAQRENARLMNAVLEKLKAAGVPQGAIRTLSVSLQPEFDYRDGRQTLRGYLARNVIEVTVDDLARLGDVMDTAVAAGASNVDDVRFDVKERDALERQALERAVRDAVLRAEAAAAGAGRKVAFVQRIVEGRQRREPPIPMMAAERAAMAEVPTPVIPGAIEIRAEVTVTAVLE